MNFIFNSHKYFIIIKTLLNLTHIKIFTTIFDRSKDIYPSYEHSLNLH